MKNISTRAIVVKLQLEGVHYWKDCPIEEVSFLRDPHRHMFHIRILKEVNHNDRDVEIIQLKRKIKTHMLKSFGDKNSVCQFENMSCEMIAEYLINKFNLDAVEVLEDGENGAYLQSL